MKTFYLKTLGCKTNQLENEIIINNLTSLGYEQVCKAENADYYILNSCAVTEISSNESLHYLKSIKNKYPKITTILTGCVAQLEHERLKNEDSIDIIIGNNEKLSIGEYISNHTNSAVEDIFKIREFNHRLIHTNSRTRANLKIQDGCNNRCTYCTIPLARGNSRSNPIQNIVEQINIFTQENINEIILTGIHIGQWGLDFKDKKTLTDLLREIEKTDIKRYRLGSLEPPEINDELIEFLASSKKFCSHFHISIQSMCDNMLSAMNRHYSAGDVLKIIKRLNTAFDKPFLGCDIIVGFPNESEEDFETVRNNLESAELSQIHVFPYSKRNGTPAAEMENQTPENIKKIRAAKIKTISNQKYTNFLKKNLNTIHEVQIQKNKDKKTNYYKGLTRNYINILVTNNKLDINNQIHHVKIVKIKENNVFAEIIS